MQVKRLKSGAAKSAPVFAALGDETRLRLVARLCKDGPVSISSLASGAQISRQAITKHLQVLARAGVVRGSRQGREQVYELETKELQQARQYLKAISREWEEALDRLKLSVKNG